MSYEILPVMPRKEKKKPIPFISLTRFDEIRVCKLARKIYNFPTEGLVEVGFLKDEKLLRLKLVENNGHKMIKGIIYTKGFYEHFSIKERGRFPISFYDNALFIDLKDKSLQKDITK